MVKQKIGGGFLSDDCGEVIFIPKCNVCKKRPYAKCEHYNNSKKHIKYRGVVDCKHFEEDKNSLSYNQYKELENKLSR